MKLKIYRSGVLLLLGVLALRTSVFAQDISVWVSTDLSAPVKTKHRDKKFTLKMDDLGNTLKIDLKNLDKDLALSLNNISPEINFELYKLGKKLNLEIHPKINIDVNPGDFVKTPNLDISGGDMDSNDSYSIEKIKSYSKSYPIDANDKIKLSNQYGKITVNTWDKHELKVDVQIKAQAGNDNDAQKLLDGVQINDSKNGDLVSFRTAIERNRNSWGLFNLMGNKMHKLEINYTVYMPVYTDLNVEDSYGSILLPDLSGRVKISSAYGSVSAQNLANASNEIEGSYGSLKVGIMNGGKLAYSYGSVDMEECTNLKADLSYGSFKLGKLIGAADFNISYDGGFKIGEVASTFKKLNINASYSGVSLGVPDNNFDFDITTSYGGFKYNDDKVTITSKTPPDGSKHIGTTRNFKGHVGKGGSEAQVNIHTSYGGVNFE